MRNPSMSRLHELEQRFTELAEHLPETPEKEALSLLHAMLIESRRQQPAPGASGAAGQRSGQPMTLDMVANLYKSAPPMEGKAETRGLPVGQPAPDFTLPDANGQPVSLSDYRGQNVLLVFYPLDWSPGCSDQLSLYQNELPEFERHHTQVLGISVDSLYSHGAWAAVRGLTFPLLSDFNPHGAVAQRYAVMRSDGFSDRALFLVDAGGTIRYAHVAPRLHMVPDVYELFGYLERLQAKEKAQAA